MRISRKRLRQRLAVFANVIDRYRVLKPFPGDQARVHQMIDPRSRAATLFDYLELAPPPDVRAAIEAVLTLDGDLYVWDPIETLLSTYLDSLEEACAGHS